MQKAPRELCTCKLPWEQEEKKIVSFAHNRVAYKNTQQYSIAVLHTPIHTQQSLRKYVHIQ